MTYKSLPFVLLLNLFLGVSYGQIVVDLIDNEENTLWGTGNFRIHEWNMDSADSVRIDSVFAQGVFKGLAIGHIRVSEDTILNTYICSERDSGVFKYWDNENWQSLDTFFVLANGIGAYGNDWYLVRQFSISHYDGDTIRNIKSDFGWGLRVADVAVDELGQAWYLTGKDIFPSDYLTDSLQVIDRNGNTVAAYPLSSTFQGQGTYGMSMVKDTIYVAFRESHITYPQKVIAIVIEEGVARITDKIIDISNHPHQMSDLASNTPGNPMNNITSFRKETTALPISIFPNPTQNTVTIDGSRLLNTSASLYTISGVPLADYLIDRVPYTLDLSKLPAGLYVLRCGKRSQIIVKN